MATRDHIAVGSAALNTSTGSQDLTIASLGWTPKAIMLICSQRTAQDNTPGGDANWVVGFADDSGGTGWVSTGSKNSQASTDTVRSQDVEGSPTSVKILNTSGTTVFEFTVDSADATAGPIADGWRIDLTTAFTSAYYVTYVLFGGTGLSASVETVAAGASVTNTATVTPGFETNLLLSAGVGLGVDGLDQAQYILSLGAMSYDGSTITQRAILTNEQDAQAASVPQARLETDSIAGQYYNGTVNWTGEVTAVNSTQVTVTTRDGSSGSDDLFFLCINLPAGQEAKVFTADSPTSAAADWTVSGVGFQPDAVGLFTTMLTAVDTSDTSANAGVTSAIIHDGTDSRGTYHYIEDAQATTDTGHNVRTQFVYQYEDDQSTLAFDIDPASSPFNSDGWTVDAADIGTANGTTRKWIGWAVGAASSGITGTLAETEEADTSAASGTIKFFATGTIAETEAADTSAASGTVSGGNEITGTIAETETADVVSMVGVVNTTITGTIGVTEQDDEMITPDAGGLFPSLRGDELREELRRKRNKRYRGLRNA